VGSGAKPRPNLIKVHFQSCRSNLLKMSKTTHCLGTPTYRPTSWMQWTVWNI